MSGWQTDFGISMNAAAWNAIRASYYTPFGSSIKPMLALLQENRES